MKKIIVILFILITAAFLAFFYAINKYPGFFSKYFASILVNSIEEKLKNKLEIAKSEIDKNEISVLLSDFFKDCKNKKFTLDKIKKPFEYMTQIFDDSLITAEEFINLKQLISEVYERR